MYFSFLNNRILASSLISLLCVADGSAVDPAYCKQQLRDGKGGTGEISEIFHEQELSRSCFRPCMGKCFLTGWSHWSLCHRQCEEGVFPRVASKTRSRVGYVVGKVSSKQHDPIVVFALCF